MNEFLRTHQDIVAPIIEWGGMILLLIIILSPFLVIRHRIFRPTRWWHIVGAYFGSFAILAGLAIAIEIFDKWIIYNYLNSIELAAAYGDATFKAVLLLLIGYPLLTFYGSVLLYGAYTRRRLFLTLLTAVSAFLVLAASAFFLIMSFVGWAIYANLN